MTPIAGILRRKPPQAAPRRAGRVGSGAPPHQSGRSRERRGPAPEPQSKEWILSLSSPVQGALCTLQFVPAPGEPSAYYEIACAKIYAQRGF
jgi:hypothetical protein